MIKHRRWVISLLISTMVIALSGCGDTKETSSQIQAPVLSHESEDDLKEKLNKLLPPDVQYVEGINEDGSAIIALRGERGKSQSAQLLRLDGEELKVISEVELEPTAPHENIIGGKLVDGNRAIFIDSGIGAHSMLTEIVVYDGKNKLIKIGDMNDSFLFKPYSLYSEDINNDGIIEAGGMSIPEGYEDAPLADIPFTHLYADYKIDRTKEIIKEIKAIERNSLEDNSEKAFEKGYYDYTGTINDNLEIEMSIYPLKDKIVGTYFYKTENKKIKLEGKIEKKEITLYEYGEKGENTGTFRGRMKTVDQIEGMWISGDGKRKYSFILSLKSILPGAEQGRRYGVALNTKNDEDVNKFINEIQSYIIKESKEELAEAIAYPITVNVNGTKTKIQNKDEFIKSYNKIFHENYKIEMSTTSTRYLFASAEGIMFGEGSYNLWINEVTSADGKPKLAITAINN